MGNSNSIDEKVIAEITQPIKEIFEKLNKEVKDGLINLLAKRIQPMEWLVEEKTYDYSARDAQENNKESFKITFYPNGTCSTLEIKFEGKEDYNDHFSFGIFFPSVNGINVQTVTLGHTKGWSFKHETCKVLELKEYYFARKKVVDELISYSELIKNKSSGPYILAPSE